ncbi:MAG: TetR/AcrR family transcriptional regulator [Bacteroidales bacterium]|nr:TetR/AcrR family transcriptional regulator [Bacteroidales bacterium]
MTELTQRQEQIIDKAIRLIDQKGIQGLTIKNLAKETGVTEGAIYRHFENKKQILSAILDMFREKMKAFQTSARSTDSTTYEKIQATLNNLGKFFEANPAIVSVIFAEEIFQNDSELSEKVAELIKENQEFMLALIQEGKANGELRGDLDDQMMVNNILGTFRLIVKMWKMEEFSLSLEGSLKDFLDYLKITIFK